MELNFSRSALVIIDVQNDFCPKGALEVKDGDGVIEPLNRLSALFGNRGGHVIATQDWHPSNHVSFASSHENKKPGDKVVLAGSGEQMLWPCHCVQGTTGADFHERLEKTSITLVIRKGFRTGLDSYSAFFENDRKTSTGLDGFLRALSIDTLVLGGLALDYCVLYSALDAAKLKFNTIIAGDAVRGVDIPSGSVEQALKLLSEAGVTITESGDIK